MYKTTVLGLVAAQSPVSVSVIHQWQGGSVSATGDRCASGCVVDCRICNYWEVAGSHLSLGYFAPRSTQPSIPLGSVNEYLQT